jgi:hypothetical protein
MGRFTFRIQHRTGTMNKQGGDPLQLAQRRSAQIAKGPLLSPDTRQAVFLNAEAGGRTHNLPLVARVYP